MVSLTKYAGTVTQVTGGKYCSFSNLNNIKNNDVGSYAVSNVLIQGKSESPNRPSTITCTNFGFNLPVGAEPTKVVITYRHQKVAGSDYSTKYPKRIVNIPAPTISLVGVSGFSSKAVAPSTSLESHTKTFKANLKDNNNLDHTVSSNVILTRSIVNSSNFGVKINYPTNTNEYNGYMRISFVRITVEYKVSSYNVSIKKVSGGYNKEDYTIQCSISNKNLTGYDPICTLTSPVGFNFKESGGTGTITQVNNRTFTWDPKLSAKVGTSSVNLVFVPDVTYPSGSSSYSGEFTLVESLNSATNVHTAVITERPPEEEEDVNPDKPIEDGEIAGITVETEIRVIAGEPFKLDFGGKDRGTYLNLVFYNLLPDHDASMSYDGDYYYISDYSNSRAYRFIPENLPVDGDWIINNMGRHTVGFVSADSLVAVNPIESFNFYINVIPPEDDLTVPFLTLIDLDDEEINRLGDGYPYIVESLIKHTTTDITIRDWYKNNRIGVFNNRLKPLFEDFGVTGNSKLSYWFWNTNYGSGSVGDDGTTFTATNTSNYITVSATLTSPATSSIYVFNFPLTVEFDIISYEDPTGVTDYSRVRVYNNANTNNCWWAFKDYGVGHYKIVCSEGSQELYYNDVLQDRSFTFTSTTAWNVAFQTKGHIKYKNFKIYDDSIDIDNLSPQQIYENAEYWAEQTAGLNEYNNIECEFPYNENYPLYILMTGDYPESTSYGYDQGEVSFTEPCIIEKNTYTGRKTRGNFPIPINYVIAEDGSTSECSIPTLNQSDQVVLYDLPLDDGYGTDDEMSIRGIELIGNLEQCDEMILNAKLISDTGLVGERSLLIGSLDTTLDSGVDFKVGGLGDLWGFNTQDLTNIEDWEVRLSFNNVLLEDVANINFGDLQLILYVEELTKQLINIKVDGDDLSYYGAFIDNVVIPEGLETDTSFLTLDGTDTNDAYRQNIREKEIELSLTIGDCDLGSSTDLLRQLTRALVNEKDSINRPIPKRIEFSHYPDVYFEYIMKDALDITPKQSYYEVKAKLVIPAGTSYSKQATTTNLTGYVKGLAAVNPLISLKPQGSTIELLEINSRQRFSITYDGDWQSKILELDCSNRMALLKTIDDDTDPVDISGYVDFNSDWFSLKGEYAFSTTNCVVRTVEYTERW